MSIQNDSEKEERKTRYYKHWKERETLIVPLLGYLLLFLKDYPFGKCLVWMQNHCKSLQSHSVVEIYVVSFLFLEIIIFVLVSQFMPLFLWTSVIITFILSLRIIDLAQSWVDVHLVYHKDEILAPVRTLILTLVNYVELILCFSIFTRIWNNVFDPVIDTLSKSVSFVIGTMTAIGSKYEPVSFGAWFIYIAEICFMLFFLIIVVVRVVSYFEQKRKRIKGK